MAGHSHSVDGIAVAPDGTWLVTTGRDSTMRIWDTATGLPVAVMRFEHPASTCVWTTDVRSIGVGGRSGLYLFDFHPLKD